jgi:uncharacterized protein (DUF1501 family)
MTMVRLACVSRRGLLTGSGALFAWAHLPKLARAEGRDPRCLIIVLRGALDGLAAVAPYGDPAWVSVRGDNALAPGGKPAAGKLDDFFALHPGMPNLHRMFQAGEATIVHAVASPYRDRSHFDGQDVLESGVAQPGASETGWLNRALAGLAPEARVPANAGKLVAVGPVTPLVARGPAPVLVWAPPRVLPASDDVMGRLLNLYRQTDPELARVFADRMNLTALLRSEGNTSAQAASQGAIERASKVRAYFVEAAGGAARVLANAAGPRVGAMALEGWDTHADEGIFNGRLTELLGALDAALGAVQTNMGPAWRETVVAVITEFGRTVHINGTHGTDHGTATVALLAGGALKGGRVITDWPGLAAANLYEGRDLKPTTNLHAVLKGVLRDHLRVNERVLDTVVFPDSAAVKPMPDLMG